MKHESIILAK